MPTMGLDDAEYRQRASAAGKASILLWLVGRLLYNTYFRHLISISSLLLVAPGMFVASLVALTVLWVDLLKDRILLRQRARRLQGQRRAADWVVLAVATVVVHEPALARRTRGPCCESAEWGRDVGAPGRAFSYSTCTGATTTRRLRIARRSCLVRLANRTPSPRSGARASATRARPWPALLDGAAGPAA